jgi:S-adenosyl-L-methionine hydrolase (adenosine-forming)
MTNLITIMTDFGLRDGFTAVMKGVIWRIAPEVNIVDVSHLIGPQNVREGALVFGRGAVYYPENTIHICVVDPGVGTHRRPMAAQFGSQYFVGPDNGLITFLHARAQREGWPMSFVHLDQPQYWLPEISNVFHGRDIFAPVAAHLASGRTLTDVGTPITDPILFPFAPMEKTATGLHGEIIHTDHFGNIISSIRATDIEGFGNIQVKLRYTTINGLVRTFGDREPGELVAFIGSSGDLCVAVTNGNAAEKLGAQVGDSFDVIRVP